MRANGAILPPGDAFLVELCRAGAGSDPERCQTDHARQATRAMLNSNGQSRDAALNAYLETLTPHDREAFKDALVKVDIYAPSLGVRSDRTSSRFQLLTDVEIASMQPPDHLVEGIIETGAAAMMYGASGSGKSFTAMDISFSVGTAMPWLGRYSVRRGPVIYVAAEAPKGMGQRVRAWKQVHGWLVDEFGGVYFLMDAVQLHQGEAAELLHVTSKLPELPALIVLDTIARCFVGGDENSAQDVGRFVAGLEQLRRETHACILGLHHTTKYGDVERGNSAWRAAFDTMMLLDARGDVLTLSCDKQRDGEPFEPIKLRRRSVELGSHGSSCVIEVQDGDGPEPRLRPQELAALDALRTQFEGAAKSGEWQAVTGLRDGTFQQVRTTLLNLGLVVRASYGRYQVAR